VTGSSVVENSRYIKSLNIGPLSDALVVGGSAIYEHLTIQPQSGGGNNQFEVFGSGGSSTSFDWFIGKSGGNPVRIRANGAGALADITHAGRVFACGDVNYTMFYDTCEIADVYTIKPTTARTFNFATGGTDRLNGRKVRVVLLAAFNVTIFTGSESTVKGSTWTSGNGNFVLQALGDFAEFQLMDSANNLWTCWGVFNGTFKVL
jgi:hypothetical protein